ncbi:putative ATP-dependent helicase Lhr [Planctopirus ephydatiae]|uniref:Putative ATP-dependent helicase Lhr n=1 Tax=Planctopirus ephydatiae TaxID=2528019 RepID=A0A518GT95_9PLAN|nr:ligase-associated DNA damage response DEXH box helicase [Planctopirus ephydatiae]QDV31806.1 putative ATP-dependent helicase Lhr [Planctopirus ephydatiae]
MKPPRPRISRKSASITENLAPGLDSTSVVRADLLQPMRDWFTSRGWQPFPFQEEVWQNYLAGESGLVHATTGTGKTYAAWGGPLLRALHEEQKLVDAGKKPSQKAPGLKVLWITPLRALAADTENALQAAVQDLKLPWLVERRTGDTSATTRRHQRERLPTALITTPESLSLLLARADAQEQLANLECVVFDEWHELLGGKRGTQAELCLARLRCWQPRLQVWGLSATLGNLEHSCDVLLGRPTGKRIAAYQTTASQAPVGKIVHGATSKSYAIDSMIPPVIERFPWAGHLGVRLLPQVIERIEAARSTLVFTNTRAQTELWYQAILKARPDWAGELALHHGSLDQDVRRWVEQGLREGKLKAVVCTSSLDLGVDFSPVDQVLQVGSPKGVARLLQRAGRAGHQPGALSRVVCVPTHALELVEFAAARESLEKGHLEARIHRSKPLDVLVQHAVTVALGTGFRAEDLLQEVRQSSAYHDLHAEEWEWVLDFIHRGGEALRAYPDYQRVDVVDGEYRVTSQKVARQHRMAIGTIVGDASLSVVYRSGARLGTIEESFVSKMKPGDRFIFSGKLLELIRVYDMKAYVKPATGKLGPVPRWMGGRMPLSTELSKAVRNKLDEARKGLFLGPEMEAVRPILEVQADWSLIPAMGELLVETLKSREGYHYYFYPFEGRLVHEGLASLFAYRLAQRLPVTFTMAINDYGFELLATEAIDVGRAIQEGLFSEDQLEADIEQSLNAVEMARRQFREVARISGLISQGFPGAAKSTRHLQASAGLLHDVFTEYDPDNLLLRQARQEVLEQQLESNRLRETLVRLQGATIQLVELPRFTPLAFPLMVDRLRERLTSEKLEDRIRKMQIPLEKAATSRRK